MAWSSAYDEWQDPGLAFDEDQLGAFDREAWALNHRDDGVEALAVLRRYTQLPNMPKPTWASKTERLWAGRLQFFCIKAEVPAWDDEALVPSPRTAAGKALSGAALALDVRGWTEAQLSGLEAALRQYVSIVRSMPRPAKAIRSLDNRLVNAIVSQRQALESRLGELDSMIDS